MYADRPPEGRRNRVSIKSSKALCKWEQVTHTSTQHAPRTTANNPAQRHAGCQEGRKDASEEVLEARLNGVWLTLGSRFVLRDILSFENEYSCVSLFKTIYIPVRVLIRGL